MIFVRIISRGIFQERKFGDLKEIEYAIMLGLGRYIQHTKI